MFSDPGVRAEAEDQALLLSELLREVADSLTPTRKQNRGEAIKRLKLEKQKKEDQDAQLFRDGSYVRGLVLAGAKYLFVDFCGLILFRALSSSIYDAAGNLLQTRSMKPAFTMRDVEPMRNVLLNNDFETADVFAVLWGAL